MKTIAEFQKAAFALAATRGEYSRPCETCQKWRDVGYSCGVCHGTKRVPIDPRSPTRIAARLERIHRAIGEAGECVDRGTMHAYYVIAGKMVRIEDAHSIDGFRRDLWKPEGFPIALATVFLRLCELAEVMRLNLSYGFDNRIGVKELCSPEDISAALADLHYEVAAFSRMAVPDCFYTIRCLHNIARGTGVNLLEMAELKLEYESGRT